MALGNKRISPAGESGIYFSIQHVNFKFGIFSRYLAWKDTRMELRGSYYFFKKQVIYC